MMSLWYRLTASGNVDEVYGMSPISAKARVSAETNWVEPSATPSNADTTACLTIGSRGVTAASVSRSSCILFIHSPFSLSEEASPRELQCLKVTFMFREHKSIH